MLCFGRLGRTKARMKASPILRLTWQWKSARTGGPSAGAVQWTNLASLYAREDILEGYYTARLWRGVYISPELQWAVHPGYNKDRGPVIFPRLRLHLEL